MKAQVILATTGLASSAAAMDLALPVPPMGFNNWARFMTNISESMFVEAAVAMSNNGLLQAGYKRLNLDDAWSTMERAANGSMVPDPVKFPSGFPWLTKFMKSRGFIPGIYTDAGNLSCGGYPGALNYEERDLNDFQDWGFEYLKMDGCNLPDDTEATYHEIYSRWPKLIEATSLHRKHRIIFSNSAPAYFSNQPNLTDWYSAMGWAASYGDLARHSADVVTYPNGNAWDSIMFNYGQNLRLARFQKPGFFNDPDFLIPDHPSLTLNEKKSQFALWCSMSSPLLLSAHIPSLPDDTIAFLTNKDLIAVNQDRLGQQATLVSRDGTWDVLTKSLDNGERLVTVLNRGDVTASLNIPWGRLGISTKRTGNGKVEVRNLWNGHIEKLPVYLRHLNVTDVPPHGTAVYRLRCASENTPTGAIFNTNTLNCLTDDRSGAVKWAACNGSEGQVWVIRPNGNINSLLRPNDCLADDEGLAVSKPRSCNRNPWTYKTSGNVVNNFSGKCLTEAADGTATTEGCGYLLNEQVLALPVGVQIAQY